MQTQSNATTESAVRRRKSTGASTHHVTPRPLLDPIREVKRESIHWKRKVFHVIGIGAAGFTFMLTDVTGLQAVAILAPMAALFVFLDALRFFVPSLNKKVKKDFGSLMRDYELDGLSGSSWFWFSGLLSMAIFPKFAAGLGIVYLALGDPAASFVGVRWGKIKIPGGKSLEGSLALGVVCTIVGTILMTSVAGLGLGSALLVASVAAVAAAFAEWLPIKRVDDNFTVPLLTSGVAALLLVLL